MLLEFDHLFICTDAGAPAVDWLCALGVTEGTPNTHPGQGTTNRRIFFHNAMLEFLWVHDEREARAPQIAPTRLWERWRYRQTGFSPFGIALRSRTPAPTHPPSLPFATWAYHPPYLPSHLEIDVASHTTPAEPLLFYIPFGEQPAAAPAVRRQPLDHAIGWREITHVSMSIPTHAPLSDALRALAAAHLVTITVGPAHLAEVEFDHGHQGQLVDGRPWVPLRLRW